MIPSKVLFPLECGFIDMYPGALLICKRQKCGCVPYKYIQPRTWAQIFIQPFKQKLSTFIFNKHYLVYSRVLTYIFMYIV